MKKQTHLLAYLLPEKVAAWHRDMTRMLAERFGVHDVAERIPPHATIFRPFTCGHDELERVRLATALWAKVSRKLMSFRIRGYGSFGNKVAFVSVVANQAERRAVGALASELVRILALTRLDFPIWEPHATLAHREESSVIREIMAELEWYWPRTYTVPFDHVALLRLESEGWREIERFSIGVHK